MSSWYLSVPTPASLYTRSPKLNFKAGREESSELNYHPTMDTALQCSCPQLCCQKWEGLLDLR